MDSLSDKFAREDKATENTDVEPEPKFQFSLRTLFALTTVGALGAFVIRLLWPSETFRLVFMALLFFSIPCGLFVLFRSWSWYRNYRRLSKNWRNCQRKRQELENWAQEKSSHKAQAETNKANP